MKRQLRDILEEYDKFDVFANKTRRNLKFAMIFILISLGIWFFSWFTLVIGFELYEYEIPLLLILIPMMLALLIWYYLDWLAPRFIEQKYNQFIDELRPIFVKRLKDRYNEYILNHLSKKSMIVIGNLEVYQDNQSISIVAPWSMIYSDLAILPFEIEWLKDFDVFSLLELYIQNIPYNQILSVKKSQKTNQNLLSTYDLERIMLDPNLEISAIRVEGENVALGIANDLLYMGNVQVTEINFKEDKLLKTLYLPIDFYSYLSDRNDYKK